MKLHYRNIDFDKDREYVLERHCRINYECDTPWARQHSYEKYRDDWFLLVNQVNGFYNYLIQSANDMRTIAEIIEEENGERVGYLWVTFHVDDESGFSWAEIRDIYIEEQFRKKGIASELMLYAEYKAMKNGAKVIRSGTGCDNIGSVNIHKKLGYYQYRYEFEKNLL